MRKQILIICIYIGELPWYFKFFLKSFSFNKDIDFLILCDQDMTSKGISNNIKIKRYDLQDFKKDVHRSLNINTPIQNGYKLCDFKPAYGYIFSRYIEGYDFWGYWFCLSSVSFSFHLFIIGSQNRFLRIRWMLKSGIIRWIVRT